MFPFLTLPTSSPFLLSDHTKQDQDLSWSNLIPESKIIESDINSKKYDAILESYKLFNNDPWAYENFLFNQFKTSAEKLQKNKANIGVDNEPLKESYHLEGDFFEELLDEAVNSAMFQLESEVSGHVGEHRDVVPSFGGIH